MSDNLQDWGGKHRGQVLLCKLRFFAKFGKQISKEDIYMTGEEQIFTRKEQWTFFSF